MRSFLKARLPRVECPSCLLTFIPELLDRHMDSPVCRTQSWLDAQLTDEWVVIDGGRGVQQGWPTGHRRDFESPYIARSDRAHRIALHSPMPGVATGAAISAVQHYQRRVGGHQPKSVATTAVFRNPPEVVRTMATVRAFGHPFWASLPVLDLMEAYAAAGIGPADAAEWHRMLIVTEEAIHWLRNGFAVDEVEAWRTVTPYPWYAGAWRQQGFTPDRAGAWTAVQVLDAHDAAVWEAAGFKPKETRGWNRFPAETALWWKGQGLSVAETDHWLCTIGHTDKESRDAFLRSRHYKH